MSAITRAELVVKVARLIGHYATGTASSGSITTLVDLAGLYAPERQWVNHYLYILTAASSAAPEGEESLVTGHVQTTGRLTMDPALTAVVASGATYEVSSRKRDDVIAAINSAIRTAGDSWLLMKVDDTTVVIAENDFDYTLPTDIVRLLSVYTRDTDTDPWLLIRNWKVAKTPGGQELVFSSLDGMDPGHLIRLDYVARPSQLTADSGTLGVGEPAEAEMIEYIVAQSVYLLLSTGAGVAEKDFPARMRLAQQWKGEAEMIKSKTTPFYTTGTAHSRRWTQTARG